MNVDDRDLWSAWRDRHDEPAFGALLKRHGPFARGYAKRLGCSETDAEDLVQRSFAKLAGEKGDKPAKVGMRAWLGRELLQEARMDARSGERRRIRERAAARVPDTTVDPIEMRDAVDSALSVLDPEARQAVELRYLHDLEYGEIAFILGKSALACRVRVHRALAHLRRRLGSRASLLIAAWGRPNASPPPASWIPQAATVLGGGLMAVTAKVVGGVVVAGALAFLLVRARVPWGGDPVPGEARSSPEGPRSAGEDPALASRPGPTVPSRRAHVLQLRVTSECGGGSVAAAVCGRDPAGAAEKEPQVTEVLAGPSGPDGVLELDESARKGAEPLWISAPGYETKVLENSVWDRATSGPVGITLAKETRIVGEMTWPATWLGHVSRPSVMAGLAPAKDGEPWTARPLILDADGRNFRGVVRGCGRHCVVFNYLLDDREGSSIAKVEIDARTGPEIHVPMLPSPTARQPEADPPSPWRILVTDEKNAPIEGATVQAHRKFDTYLGAVHGSWTTDRTGEAVRPLWAGTYYFTVSKRGWGTHFGRTEVSGEQRDTVVLVPARTKIVVNLARTPTEAPSSVSVELRQRAEPGDAWTWHPLETLATNKAEDRLEFMVTDGHEYALFARGGVMAPVAVVVPRIAPEERERVVHLSMDPGESVEVRGLEQEPITAQIGLFVEYEGVLGEILTATPRARFEGGKWSVDHVARGAGEVRADIGVRRLRGRLPASGEKPRIIELR